MDDIGSAAGVTGPALYHHFPSKEAMLAYALTPVSQRLLDGAVARIAEHTDASAALAALVDFHVGFALENPAVITLHLHELDRLPAESQRQIRQTQRRYVTEWVSVLCQVLPDVPRVRAKAAAQAAFGLMNSTPFLRQASESSGAAGVPRSELRRLLCTMALSALLSTR